MKKELSWSAVGGILMCIASIVIYFYESFSYMTGDICPSCVHSTVKTIDFFATFYEYMALGSFIFLIFFLFNIRQEPKKITSEVGILVFLVLSGIALVYINTK